MDNTFDPALINKWVSEVIFLEDITQAILGEDVQISVGLIGADDKDEAAFTTVINQKIRELAEMKKMEENTNG